MSILGRVAKKVLFTAAIYATKRVASKVAGKVASAVAKKKMGS